ncbi:MAG: putative sugar nucleotidyl transferase [bacterium]
MEKNICIFEDDKFSQLFPLVYCRPVFDLKCGILTLEERIKKYYSTASFHIQCRENLVSLQKQKNKAISYNDLKELENNGCLFLNGKILIDQEFVNNVNIIGPDEIGICQEEVVYIRASSELLKKIKNLWKIPLNTELVEKLKQIIKVKEIKVNLINYIWDTIKYNSEMLQKDYEFLIGKGKIEGFIDPLATIYGDKKNLYTAKNSRIEAGVVINLTSGPVYLDEDACIRPPSIIDGPCYIGKKTVIDGAKLRSGNSIGPVCKIAGELEESIILGYSNKHHDGFLGHAYLGEWVNLGAMTTNSDLKNNYGEIKIYVNGELINTGEIKLGCFIGDHTKTGIGTLINTGSTFGVASNLFGGKEVLPKFVPSFSWGDGTSFVVHNTEKAISNAKKIMARRKVVLTDIEANILKEIFETTKEERKNLGIK